MGCANFPRPVPAPTDRRARAVGCHGAPGLVICLADCRNGAPIPYCGGRGGAGRGTPGPLKRVSGNLCHGRRQWLYVLKLYRRTGRTAMARPWREAFGGCNGHRVRTDGGRVRYGKWGAIRCGPGENIGVAIFNIADGIDGSASLTDARTFSSRHGPRTTDRNEPHRDERIRSARGSGEWWIMIAGGSL